MLNHKNCFLAIVFLFGLFPGEAISEKEVVVFNKAGNYFGGNTKVVGKDYLFSRGRDEDLKLKKEVFFSVGNTRVWRIEGDGTFFFEAGMAIDADGAPDTYHPDDIGEDFLAYAGRPGNWGALVTDSGRRDGIPIIQGPGHPNPGYYISTTSLEDKTKPRDDPGRYVNSKDIPYIVLPLGRRGGAKLGDFSVVVNRKNGKISYAIFADLGPKNKIGEGSIAIARSLGINSNPKFGGVANGIVYVIFPGSGSGKPVPLPEINYRSEKIFKEWGGMEHLEACFQE